MLRRLVLWDVDGTLLRAGPVGAEVFDLALADVLGTAPPGRVRMSGKTDVQIMREYLEMMDAGLEDEVETAVLEKLHHHLSGNSARIGSEGMACPGVIEVLIALHDDPSVVSSLLTGNIQPNAVVKVSAFGLERWLDLDVGAYGSDNADRTALVPVALERLRTVRGISLEPDQVWIVGDTPRDFAGASAGGAHCLLVATGRYSMDELKGLGADEVIEDLSETARILKILGGS